MTNKELRAELTKSLINDFCHELLKLNDSNNPNLILMETEVLETLREKYDKLEFEHKILNRLVGEDESVLKMSDFVKFTVRKKYLNETN